MNKKIEFIKDADVVITNDASSLDLQEFGFMVIAVDRKSVVHGNVNHPLKVIRELEESESDFKGKVTIMFDGFDDDHRGLFEIPEVRRWVSRLVKRKPHVFYFLNEDTYTRQLFLACLFEGAVITYEGDQKGIELYPEPEKLLIILDAVNNLMTLKKERDEQIDNMVRSILKFFTIPRFE